MKGVSETVAAATTYTDASGNIVLEMDLEAATVYTYTCHQFGHLVEDLILVLYPLRNVPANAQNGIQ